MLPRKLPARESSADFRAEVFLRSINLRFDAEHPERIGHYRPTAKSAGVVRALLGDGDDRAFFVVAPYGSGKSLTASFLLQLVENRAEAAEILDRIATRFAAVSPELAERQSKRRSDGRQGFVIALHGHCPSIAQAIHQGALETMRRQKLGREGRAIARMPAETIDDAIAILSLLAEKAQAAGRDRILVVWDEFGRHLEWLLAEGRGVELAEIQLLAEYVTRSPLPMALGLLLHQGLLHYASGVPQSLRGEWKKIEGRFAAIQYVDESKEIYRLIGEIVASRERLERPTKRATTDAARKTRELGLFPGVSQKDIAQLLRKSYPLEPATLYLLPRLSARVAQNERTLFSFLFAADLTKPIGPDVLYDYFASEMQSDVVVGGTYRQWLETQSALSKVGGDETSAKALKAACLLGLGLNGERSRSSSALVRYAVAGYASANGAHQALDRLLGRKLLLHRKHSDELSVWHGTDLDLRGRLEEETRRGRQHFDLVNFLTQEVPLPVWRPLEYNDEFSIRRYLAGEFTGAKRLERHLRPKGSGEPVPAARDGKVLYVVARAPEELSAAVAVTQQQLKDDRLLVVLPSEPLDLFEAALEVWCLQRMQEDAELVGSDPMTLPELQQMTDDARGHLQSLLDTLLVPNRRARWFYRGEDLGVETTRELRRALSKIMRRVFPKTPRINNEMIVKNRPSATLINSRKKLVLGILERSGRENLGIEGNFPDASMFRTVLLHTGLYRESDGAWGYAMPAEVDDPGLRAVWGEFEEFLTRPATAPKNPEKLFKTLQGPPYGVRAGIIPILLAAALKAFPSALSLSRDGEYVDDILPSVIEDLCKKPERFRLSVVRLTQAKRRYLEGVRTLFGGAQDSAASESDLVRGCFDSLAEWKSHLPPGALTSRRLSEKALAFQRAVRTPGEPVALLLKTIPQLLGVPADKPQQLLKKLKKTRNELEAVEEMYAEEASSAVRRTLRLGDGEDVGVRRAASRWAHCFPAEFADGLDDGIARGLLSRLQLPYDSEKKLLDSLASLLIGQTLERWDDSSLTAFSRELHNVVHAIEDLALSSNPDIFQDRSARDRLASLVEGRLDDLFSRLVQLVGPKRARSVVSSLSPPSAKRKQS